MFLQASYGSIQSPPHGGEGGGPAGPYVLEGQPIVKVEVSYSCILVIKLKFNFQGTTRTFNSRRYIQSLTFTGEGQGVAQFGTRGKAEGFSKFQSDPPGNCYLRYLSGSTSGKYASDPSGYLAVINFYWCCP